MIRNELICTDTPGTAEVADHAGFEKACAAALALAKSLGERWAGRVWENLGWQYEAMSPCRRVTIYPGSTDGYYAMLHEPYESGMPTYLGEVGRGRTPGGAYASVLRGARERVKKIQAIIEGL